MIKRFFLPVFLLGLFLVVPGISIAAQSPRPTPVILEEISVLLSDMKFGEAIGLFDTINPADAASSPILLLKASVLNSAGRTQEARVIVEGITVREPGNLDALFTLSAIEAASGREREQRALLEKIIAQDPENVRALTDLGSLHLRSRSFTNAADCFDRALKADETNLDALLGKASVYRLRRDPENAEALLNRAVGLYPSEAAPYHERARLYKGAGFPVQALADLDKAKALNRLDYWIAIDRGTTLLELFRKEQALEEFQRAVEINPREFLAYAYTAGIKDDLGDWDGAERDYETLAKLRPDYYFAFEGVGLHKMKRGAWRDARDAFLEVYRQASTEYCYALLAAINWMRADTLAGPRQFLNQAMTKVKRENIEYYMLRLFYDLSGRVYNGENDMIQRVERETNADTKAQMMFYLAWYFDLRGNRNLANRYFLQFKEMDRQTLIEWRLNEWLIVDRNLEPS